MFILPKIRHGGRAFAAAAFLGAGLLASPGSAQGVKCMSRDALVQSLEAKYNERLTGGGLQNEQQLLEIWSSTDTGSFTVFITRADGISCIVATGQHWNTASLIPPKGVKG